jgi:cation diffusion facilitator CzcD-associated flavoprotein CzcO
VILASGSRALTSEERISETIIVGAGIAGMACARRLDEVQHPYLLITEKPSADRHSYW